MGARYFNGLTDSLEVDVTSATATNAGGQSVVAIVRRTADGVTGYILQQYESAAVKARWFINNANRLSLTISTGSGKSYTGTTIANADGWCFAGITKTAGANPRMHIYKYGARTMTRGNTTSSALADGTALTTSGQLFIGGNTENFEGDILAVAQYNEVLDDQTIDSMVNSFHAWFRPAAAGIWLLDQDAVRTIVDLTGKGGNEVAISGTSISTTSVPIFNRHWGGVSLLEAPSVRLVTTGTGTESPGSTPVTCTLTAAPRAGDLILVFVDFNNASSGSHPVPSITGFTSLGNVTASVWSRMTAFAKISDGTEGTSISVTWTGSGDVAVGAIVLADAEFPTTVVTAADATSNTTVTIPAITTLNDLSIDVVGVCFGGNTSYGATAYSAWQANLQEVVDIGCNAGGFYYCGVGIAWAVRQAAGSQAATQCTQVATDVAGVIRLEAPVAWPGRYVENRGVPYGLRGQGQMRQLIAR